jgi:chromosome segregation ATPase
MATPAEPVPSAIFRALRSVDVDPDLAYEAAEESRRQAGENVIAALGAKIDSQGAGLEAKIDSQVAALGAKVDALSTRTDAQVAELKAQIDTQGARTDAQIAEVKAEIDTQGARTDAQIAEVKAEIAAQGARIDAQIAEIKAQGSRIEDLRHVVWRVIWPLIALLAVPIFGLLYEALAR